MPPSRTVRTLSTLAAVAAAALTLAGCSGGAEPPAGQEASRVTVTLENDGGKDVCTLDHDRVAAGPVTFTVSNVSSTAITEVELQSEQRILGEKENLAPGLKPVSFTVTLGGGTYQVYCPGAEKELQDVVVTGEAAASPSGGVQAVLADGAEGYGRYVDTVVSGMVTAVANLEAAIDSGDLAKARAEYALARPFYERIETDVDGFVLPGHDVTDNAGNLDYLIDMRASNLDPAVGWHGFHAIERDLFQGGAITEGTRALAAELARNVGLLNGLVSGIDYKPEDLANGAAGLLEEVQSEKIKGEEEAFSHLDLVDFAANVEGAQQAFAFLKPGLTTIDPALTRRIAAQFERVTTMLDGYRDSSVAGGYRLYTPELRASDANALSQAVQALQDPLSTLAEKVATAR